MKPWTVLTLLMLCGCKVGFYIHVLNDEDIRSKDTKQTNQVEKSISDNVGQVETE